MDSLFISNNKSYALSQEYLWSTHCSPPMSHCNGIKSLFQLSPPPIHCLQSSQISLFFKCKSDPAIPLPLLAGASHWLKIKSPPPYLLRIWPLPSDHKVPKDRDQAVISAHAQQSPAHDLTYRRHSQIFAGWGKYSAVLLPGKKKDCFLRAWSQTVILGQCSAIDGSKTSSSEERWSCDSSYIGPPSLSRCWHLIIIEYSRMQFLEIKVTICLRGRDWN